MVFIMEYDLLKTIAEGRSKVYWFLSEFYLKKPNENFLKEFKSKISGILSDVNEEFREALKTIKDCLEQEGLESLSTRLSVDFTRLFRGIKEGYGPPPPYESVYRGEGKVLGESTLAVMRKYAEAGFGIIEEYAGPQDYIGTELKFMSLLCYKDMKAWEEREADEGKKCLEMERRFLNDHLLQWVPNFCKEVEERASEKFYVAIAVLTESFIKKDAKILEMLLDVF